MRLFIIMNSIHCYEPDFAIAHGNLGSCYYDLGDFNNAIKSFNYAIQLEPNFADAYNNLGNALKEVRTTSSCKYRERDPDIFIK